VKHPLLLLLPLMLVQLHWLLLLLLVLLAAEVVAACQQVPCQAPARQTSISAEKMFVAYPSNQMGTTAAIVSWLCTAVTLAAEPLLVCLQLATQQGCSLCNQIGLHACCPFHRLATQQLQPAFAGTSSHMQAAPYKYQHTCNWCSKSQQCLAAMLLSQFRSSVTRQLTPAAAAGP
jgi:hypothetical protein